MRSSERWSHRTTKIWWLVTVVWWITRHTFIRYVSLFIQYISLFIKCLCHSLRFLVNLPFFLEKSFSCLSILSSKFCWNFSPFISAICQHSSIFSWEVSPLNVLLLLSLEGGWIVIDVDNRFCCVGQTQEMSEVALATVLASLPKSPPVQVPCRYYLWRLY